SQADYWQATRAPGHGDLHVLVFAPSSIQEMVDMVFDAFDLADCYRMPAMILADGMLGQMMEPISFPEKQVKTYDKSGWSTSGHQHKRAHHIVNSLYLQPEELEAKILERFQRYEEVKAKHTRCEEYLMEDAEYVVVAYGATSRIVRSSVNSAREKGIKVGLIRPLTLWPYPYAPIEKAAERGAKAFLSVEMSMGQMVDDVRIAVNGRAPVSFFGRTGGVIPTPAEVLSEIEKMAGGDR
ncbi:3-methyl-2-oxobutanoate dehydrogenase subunit beta, partial [uncultured Anaerotruncus sp.]